MTKKLARDTLCASAALLLMVPVLPAAALELAGGPTPARPLLLAQAPEEAGGDSVGAAQPEEPADDQSEQAGEDDIMDDVSEQEIAEDLGLAAPGDGKVNPRIVRRSLRSVLEKNQQVHDRMLVDQFLLWVSILFAVISLLLFLSQPPAKKRTRVAE